jgi:hypothetical protein
MTRDDIIRMARMGEHPLDDPQIDIVLRFQAVLDDFANFARAAGAAAEREACAKVAMLVAVNGIETSAAIRARSQA